MFLGRADVVQVLLAVAPARLDDFKLRWADQLAFMGVTVVPGGDADRWESVQSALAFVTPDASHIAIHDAARPCCSPAVIERVFAAASTHRAVVPGLATVDTLKQVKPAPPPAAETDPLDALWTSKDLPKTWEVEQTVPRHNLYHVQTPQVFERSVLIQSYAALNAGNAAGVTDDASVVQRAGHRVHLVEGDPLNLKLTRPEDAELIQAVYRLRQDASAKQAAERVLFGDDED